MDTVIGVPDINVNTIVANKKPRKMGNFEHRFSHFPALASKSKSATVGVISIFLAIQEQL